MWPNESFYRINPNLVNGLSLKTDKSFIFFLVSFIHFSLTFLNVYLVKFHSGFCIFLSLSLFRCSYCVPCPQEKISTSKRELNFLYPIFYGYITISFGALFYRSVLEIGLRERNETKNHIHPLRISQTSVLYGWKLCKCVCMHIGYMYICMRHNVCACINVCM